MKFCLLGLCMMMILTACSPKLTDSAFDESKINRTQDVVMRTDKEAYHTSEIQITLIITNDTDNETVTTPFFTFQILKNDQWKTLGTGPTHEVAMLIPANGSTTQLIDLDDFDFKFEPGKYRIVKEISVGQEHFISAEFTMK